MPILTLDQKTKFDIERIEQRYNGDNDIIPGAPVVTWADNELLVIIKKLIERIDLQHEEIIELRKQLNQHKANILIHGD